MNIRDIQNNISAIQILDAVLKKRQMLDLEKVSLIFARGTTQTEIIETLCECINSMQIEGNDASVQEVCTLRKKIKNVSEELETLSRNYTEALMTLNECRKKEITQKEENNRLSLENINMKHKVEDLERDLFYLRVLNDKSTSMFQQSPN